MSSSSVYVPILLTVVPFAIVLLIAGYIISRLLRNSARNRALMAHGLMAPAMILSAEDTGVTLNQSPQVRLQLQVRPANMPPFQAEAVFFLNRLQVGLIVPGTPVEVKYDPADLSKVAVASFGDVGAASFGNPAMMAGGAPFVAYGADVNAILGSIQQQVQSSLLMQEQVYERIRQTGEEAQAKVLNMMDTGVRNGDNGSMLRFGLEIFPQNRPSFRTESQCAVSEASRPKFMPGSTVYVKFDPKNPMQVAIDHAPVEAPRASVMTCSGCGSAQTVGAGQSTCAYCGRPLSA